MLGVIAMPIMVCLTSSWSGTISHAQDVPAVLIAGSAASIAVGLSAEPGLAFPTVATFVGVTSIAVGLSLYAAGRFRLGSLARLIPYSVIGGFLAATGYLLTMGAMSLMIKDSVTVWNPEPLLSEAALVRVLPWLLLAVASVIATRLTRSAKSSACQPCARRAGVLRRTLVSRIEPAGRGAFGAVARSAVRVQFSAGSVSCHPSGSALGSGGHGSADHHCRFLHGGTGLVDQCQRPRGGFGSRTGFRTGSEVRWCFQFCGRPDRRPPGLSFDGETLFAARAGLNGVLANTGLALVAAMVLLSGTSLVAVLPVGLAAFVIAYLGLDLLYGWLFVQRRRLPAGDNVVVYLILAAAAAIGFLEALSVGLLAATVLFVISCAGIDVMQLRSSGSTRHSSVERGAKDMARLAALGENTRICDLNGYLFFGTANKLLESLKSEFAKQPAPDRVVFNFARVTGIDTSATFALSRIDELCRRNDSEFILAGVGERVAARLPDDMAGSRRYHTLDDALVAVETELLANDLPDEGPEPRSILDTLAADHAGLDVSVFSEQLSLRADAVLIAQGERSNAIYQLVSGSLRAEVADASGSTLVVARFLPGALVGEVAYYADVPRTASILANTEARLIRIHLDRIPDTLAGRSAAADLHKKLAGILSSRLMRMTRLFHEAGF